ncbi:type IV secretion system DNA-binding domain-containing protein [Candidatus Microgenomates bacterium]|nr:type IV secretion system DNA-binding domain-containing protein [Candidatus Microgenomates bacterium]
MEYVDNSIYQGADLATNLLYFLYWLVVITIVILTAILLINTYRYLRYQSKKIPRALDMVLLKIMLPKKSSREEEESKKDHKELLSRASQMFSSLYSVCDTKIKNWWHEKSPHISFEIVSQKGEIFFYIALPKELLTLVEKQIHSFYPDAVLEETERHNIFQDDDKYAASELTLGQSVAMPIKTYKEFETDPLNTITNTLFKLGPEEAAAVQILIRPTKTKWQKISEHYIHSLQEGRGGPGGKIDWVKIAESTSKLGGELAAAPFKTEEVAKKEAEKTKTITPITEQKIKMIGEKAAFVGFEALVRVVVSSDQEALAKMHLNNIVSAFSVFRHPSGNFFTPNKKQTSKIVAENFVFRAFPYSAEKNILNTEELASIFHFPNRYTDTPSIVWLLSKRAAAPPETPKEGLYLGVNIYRGLRTPVYMRPKDRVRHTYIVGKTGSGKSTLMKEMIIQDIKNGQGLCYIDPHGTDADDILLRIPKERVGDVILFNPADFERPIGINLLEYTRPEEKTLVLNELMNVFDKLYDLRSTGGPMFEQYFRNAALLVMEHPESGSTIMEIPRVLSDEDFRMMKLSHCANPIIKNYWLKEAEKAGGEAALANIVPYITSKLTQFIANDIMRPMIAQQKSAFNLREVMDNQKILILRLAKGQIGEMNAYLLGLIMVSKIYLAAMSRVDMPEQNRKPFYLYIDEFQNFTTDSVASILSEARKYQLALTIGHQFINQLISKGGDTKIKDAVFGNVGTFITFRVGEEDAEFLQKKYEPVFNAYDIANLESGNAYLSLLVDNTNLRPFSLNTFLDFSKIEKNPKIAEAIIGLSRLQYGRDRNIVEEEIRDRA